MNNIPDATTIAFFRERLRKAGMIEELFEMFETYLRSQGLQARGVSSDIENRATGDIEM